MNAVKRLIFSWTTGFSNSSSVDGVFIPTTGWGSAADVAKVRCTWEAFGETMANMVTRPGFQTANTENSPDTPAAFGNDTQSSGGLKYSTAMTDISSSTQAKALVRFGIWVKLPSGSSLNCVRLSGYFDVLAPA